MCHFVTSCISQVPWIHRFVQKPNVTFSVDTCVDVNHEQDTGVVIVMDSLFYPHIKDGLQDNLRTGKDFISTVDENVNFHFMVNFLQSFDAATDLTLSYVQIPDSSQYNVIKLYTKLASLHYTTYNHEAMGAIISGMENLHHKGGISPELVEFHNDLLEFASRESCSISGEFMETPIKVFTKDRDEHISHVFSFEGLRDHFSHCKTNDPINGLPIEDLQCGLNTQMDIDAEIVNFKTRLDYLSRPMFTEVVHNERVGIQNNTNNN